ncbi:MAG: Rpn family recombination-promoting nuclease/putative transposase [Saprospiraceae bacterium]
MAKKKHTQHDRLFRATFSIKSEAELFIKKFLPWDINQFLDYDTLELKNSSFINEHLENQFSDIIYACRWEDSPKSVLLTFLFEHKSYPEKYPELQLLRYMLEGL